MKKYGFLAVLCCLLLMPVAGQANIVDLTTDGSSGAIGTGLFFQSEQAPSGTGVIDSFVRISTNNPVEQGYNTSARPLLYDENTSPTFTRDLLLSSVPTKTIGGVVYREFLLDINQQNAAPLLSLDKLQIYSTAAALTSPLPPVGTDGLLTPIYSFSYLTSALQTVPPTTNPESYIKLNYALESGSGQADMFAYIPNSLFTGAYVTLYSEFGAAGGSTFVNNDGFEEWAVQRTAAQVPIPAGLYLLGSGLLGLVGIRRRFWK